MGGGGAKKIWDDQKAAGGDAVAQHRAGGMFPGPWSREDGGWNPNHPGGPPPQHPQHMAQAKIYGEQTFLKVLMLFEHIFRGFLPRIILIILRKNRTHNYANIKYILLYF